MKRAYASGLGLSAASAGPQVISSRSVVVFFVSWGLLFDVCRSSNEWQSYGIVFSHSEVGAGGRMQASGNPTLLKDSVLVQDHVPGKAPEWLPRCVSKKHLLIHDQSRFADWQSRWRKDRSTGLRLKPACSSTTSRYAACGTGAPACF